ncbi:hypothetical protein HUJ05_002105 [Dendroctonus ponderosae]|nr:hypothetical protein HUJ05_002105 [Dendroctonus ponderosae]
MERTCPTEQLLCHESEQSALVPEKVANTSLFLMKMKVGIAVTSYSSASSSISSTLIRKKGTVACSLARSFTLVSTILHDPHHGA